VPRGATFTISVADSLADAIVGEATRRSERTSRIIEEALAETFPEFVARHMRDDLSELRDPSTRSQT
jgi:predicted transcriptional regulator